MNGVKIKKKVFKAYVTSKDSDQPLHLCSLVGEFSVVHTLLGP